MGLPSFLFMANVLFAAPTQYANSLAVPGEKCVPESYFAETFLMPPDVPFIVEVIATSAPQRAISGKQQYLSLGTNAGHGMLAIENTTNYLQNNESEQELAIFHLDDNGNLVTGDVVCGLVLEQGVAPQSQSISCPMSYVLNEQSGPWPFQSACIDNTEKLLLLPPRENDADSASKHLWFINTESIDCPKPKTVFCHTRFEQKSPGKHFAVLLLEC
jgi:hypothetical protein